MSTTRSLRNNRSRYSSPVALTEKEVPPKSADEQERRNGQYGRLDTWVEPSPRNAVPSFEDTKGLERVGVLEHMAPLGAPPSSKLLQKLKINFNRASTKTTPAESTPAPDPVTSEAASPAEPESLPEPSSVEEQVVILSPPRGRPAKKDVEEMKQVADLMTPSPVKSDYSATSPTSPRPQSIQECIRQDRMERMFQRAIAESIRHSDSRLVPGLQKLAKHTKSNAQLSIIVDHVLNKTATENQFRIFKRYIKNGIKDHRRNTFSGSSPSTQQAGDITTASPSEHSARKLRTLSSTGEDQDSLLHTNSAINSPFRFRSHVTRRHSPSTDPSAAESIATRLDPEFTAAPAESERQRRHRRSRRALQRSESVSTVSSLTTLDGGSSEVLDDEAENQAEEERSSRSGMQRQATSRAAPVPRATRASATNPPDPSHPNTVLPTSIKFVNKRLKGAKSHAELSAEEEKLHARRHQFEDESFQDYNAILRPESNVRSAIQSQLRPGGSASASVPAPVIHPHSLQLISTSASSTLLSPTTQDGPSQTVILNNTSRKRAYDEISMDGSEPLSLLSYSSPPPSHAPPPPPPTASSASATTRGTIPRNTRASPTKPRKSARVMISPNKPKNGGITAGISRAGTGRENALGSNADSGAEDNDEFCASCSGEGILLCCDGCTNSFHHACLEPPLNPDVEVDGEWYCPQCIARRNHDPVPTTGLMSQIIRKVGDTIPKAYSLPQEIRDYFEGVKTGDEGEYEELGLSRTQNVGAKMNRAGFFEEPNYKELRDNKGNFITCYRCGLTSHGRDIVPCDYCPAKWHTDCVDPPLPVAPRRRGGDKPSGYWRCPLHIDQDLVAFGRQPEAAPGDLGRLPRLRKPKRAIPIDVNLPRGFRNNGIIEVEIMDEEMPDIRDVQMAGGIFRLPERGVRLDFIDRVKRGWYEDQNFPAQLGLTNSIPARMKLYRPDRPVFHHPAAVSEVKMREPEFLHGVTAMSVARTAEANAQLRQKSFIEQSAVVTLIGMSSEDDHMVKDLSADAVSDLINTLIAEAPQEAEDLMNASELRKLERLQELVNKRLAILTPGPNRSQSEPTGVIKSAKGNRPSTHSSLEDALVNGDNEHSHLNGKVNDGDQEGNGGHDRMDISH